MKILCICKAGNVRSVAMAQYIRDSTSHEAIAIGIDTCSIETFDMLLEWADHNIDMRYYFEDYWHDPRHPVLKKKVKEIWKLEEKLL
ncbi:MAG: hypothetical protein IIA87_03385 [Nanoarchaeota archaeon]|nr:hypothetical protein [Nanoarchaeota archaeon]